MSTKNKLLTILVQNAPAFVSGNKIAKELAVSRTTIWKAIQELRKDGFVINSHQSQGYQYVETNLLSEPGIRLHLNTNVPKLKVQIVASTDSTNLQLKKIAATEINENIVLATEEQTATKGRFGRSYFAGKKGEGIYFSLLLSQPQQTLAEVAQYTIIMAVAAVKAIEKLTALKLDIKWVNDLYYQGKKVCGILSEATTNVETQTISSVIIGLGLNFAIPIETFPADLKAKATSLFPTGKTSVNRNQLIAEILNEFFTILEQLPAKDYLELYRKRSFVLGKEVTFQQNKQTYTGIAEAITETGELVVVLANQQKMTLSSGEISLKEIKSASSSKK